MSSAEVVATVPDIDADLGSEYTCTRLLAQGTEGEIYYTQHPEFKACVVKAARKKASEYRFDVTELVNMDCPTLVTVWAIITFPTYIYLVMEYCRGGDVCEYVMDHGAMTEKESKGLFLQLIEGVSYLHDRGLVHNDIKLDNILIRDDYSIALTDFGFTSRMGERYKKGFYGSVLYAAPEVINDEAIPRGENDIWSMGVVLFCVLTARFPFEDRENDDHIIARKIMNSTIRYPRSFSCEAIDFLKGIFVPLKQRKTLKQLEQHRWLTSAKL